MNKIRVRNNDGTSEKVLRTIDRLRININLMGAKNGTIAITSSDDREGKSFVAYQLACMLAVNNKKVLLLLTDFRKSVGASNVMPGVAEIVRGESKVADVVYKTDIKNMYLMFAGNDKQEAAKIVEDDRFERMLNWLKSKFDYIIVDTATVNKCMDANIVCSRCDYTIIVAEKGGTTFKKAQTCLAALELANCDVLGVVMNTR